MLNPTRSEASRSVLGNAGRNFAVLTISGACSIGTTIAVGRALAPSDVGKVALASAVATLGGGLLVVGLSPPLTRLTAEATDRARRRAIASFAFRSWFTGLVAACVLLLLAQTADVSLTSTLAGDVFVLLGVTSAAFTSVFGAILSGRKQFDRLLWIALVTQPVTLLVTVSLAVRGASSTAMVGAQALGLILTATGTCVAVREDIGGVSGDGYARARADVRKLRLHYAGLDVVGLIVWQRSEVLILGIVSSPRQVAFYALAYGLVSQVIARLPGALVGVLLPEMAGETAEGVRQTYQSSIVMMALLTMPILVVAVSSASDVAEVLFGAAYRPVGDIVRVLVFGGAAYALGSPGATVMMVSDQQRTLLRLGLARAVANVALAFALAAPFGGIGAATATVVVQTSALPVVYVIVRRTIGVGWTRPVGTIAFAGLLSAATCLVVAQLFTSPIGSVVSTGLISLLVFAALLRHHRCPADRCIRCAIAPLGLLPPRR